MIKIIKDISKQYKTNNNFIKVENLKSYFEAREKFFENYKENREFEIIIAKKPFFPYFLDFENYNGVVIKEILEAEEPKVILGSSENIFTFLLNCLKKLEGTKKDMEMLEREYLQKYKFLFKEEQSIDNLIETLVKIIVFSNYREYNFNLLLDSNSLEEMYKIAKEDQKLKESYESEKGNLSKYLLKCNEILIENSRKIQLFNEIPTEKYLDEINGSLDFERKYFIVKTVERLNKLKDYDEIKINLLKAEKIFNLNFSDIIELIDNLSLLEKYRKKEKNSLNDFKEYFLEVYLKYNSISSDKNIENYISEIENRYNVNLLSLKKSIRNIWKENNRLFEEFYLKNYFTLYSSFEKKGLDYAIENSFSLLNNNKKNIYIFIDCLRYDVWLGIKKYMQEKGWNCHLDKIVLSAIPTVTSYCKKILYTGKKFNQIENRDCFKVNKKNISNFEDIDSTNSNFLLEILDIDRLFHTITDLKEEVIKKQYEIKLEKILSKIDKENYNIIIMTDHGAMKLYKEDFSSFNDYKKILSDKGLEIENHGRYIKIYSRYFDNELYKELNDYLNNAEDFYVINRDHMNEYYLPIAENSIENYFYLIYKYGKYPKITGEYNHGGISYEEVFVPYGVFKAEIKEFIPITLELKTIELKNSIKSEIVILINNSNIVQNLKLKLKYQEFEKEYEELEGNKLIQIPLKLDDNFEGEYMDIAEIEYTFEGRKESLKTSIAINILKNQKVAINKKLKKSRSLL